MLIVLVYYDNIKLTKIREEGIVMEKTDCIRYVTWGGQFYRVTNISFFHNDFKRIE